MTAGPLHRMRTPPMPHARSVGCMCARGEDHDVADFDRPLEAPRPPSVVRIDPRLRPPHPPPPLTVAQRADRWLVRAVIAGAVTASAAVVASVVLWLAAIFTGGQLGAQLGAAAFVCAVVAVLGVVVCAGATWLYEGDQ